jgi:hypothetical protein
MPAIKFHSQRILDICDFPRVPTRNFATREIGVCASACRWLVVFKYSCAALLGHFESELVKTSKTIFPYSWWQ